MGLTIEVQTFHEFLACDERRLRKWCMNIATDILDGKWSRNELIDESIHIRISDSDKVIIDTISNRE